MRNFCSLIGIVTIPLILFGCTSYLKFIDGLNEREVQSCLEYNGAISTGTGFGSSSGSLRGITATGGASLETCLALIKINF